MKPFSSRLAVAVLSSAAVAGGFLGGEALLDRVQFARAEGAVEANRQQLSHVEDLSTVFRDVAKVVEPSVVRIDVTKTVTVPAGNMAPDGDLLRKFFQDNGQDQGTPQAPNKDNGNNGNNGDDNSGGSQGQQFEQDGTGSGVIMDTQDGYGYILTNNHVAGGATEIRVTLADGRVIEHGHLMGADPKSDLAVVRIKANDLIPAKWGNSDDLQQGDWVLAFGCPLGYAGTMTHGIVSALSRDKVGVIESKYAVENFIQVDAPINPGNSGGPLVNIHGEVVGINTAIASRTGEFNGIGLAIPSDDAHKVYNILQAGKAMVRGWLGIQIENVSDNPNVQKMFGYAQHNGVLVDDPISGTPAFGKLKGGDIIIALDGQKTANVDQLRSAVASTTPGTEVKLTVFRDGANTQVIVKLGTQPDDIASAAASPETHRNRTRGQMHEQDMAKLGLQLSDVTNQIAQQLGYDAGTTGAMVRNVKPGSIAAKNGLETGVIIAQVGHTDVTTAEEAATALSKIDIKQGVRLKVIVPGGSHFLFLQDQTDDQSGN